MRVVIDNKSNIPIYKQIVDSIYKDIKIGILTVDYKLPPVRDLAEEIGISKGTIKHAYDELERLGVIKMIQGRGSFVLGKEDDEVTSKKERAMQAIDKMLNELSELGFSSREMEIYIHLKLRSIEEKYEMVKVAVVDCNPEALNVIYKQIGKLNYVDVVKFSLHDMSMIYEKLNEEYDLIITTSTHYTEVLQFIGEKEKLARMAMSPSEKTVIALAKIPDDKKVGILSASDQFAQIIKNNCFGFGKWTKQLDVQLFGNSKETEEFMQGNDIFLLPQNYTQFCNHKEKELLLQMERKNKKMIIYDYKIDQGSFMYIEELIKKCVNQKRSR